MFENAAQVAVQFLTLYLTLGLMAVGAGLMMMGPRGARRAGRFFFFDPFVWGGARLHFLAITLLVGTWALITRLIADIWTLLVRYILRPIVEELRYWMRWLGGKW